MKKALLALCMMQLLTSCSPVDSVRTLDQQQTQALVKNMYPANFKKSS